MGTIPALQTPARPDKMPLAGIEQKCYDYALMKMRYTIIRL